MIKIKAINSPIA